MKYQSIKEEAKYSTRTTHQCNANYMRHKRHRNKVKGQGIHGSLQSWFNFLTQCLCLFWIYLVCKTASELKTAFYSHVITKS